MTPENQDKINEEVNQILFRDFKKFADQTRIFIAREYFALSLIDGQQRETFALTPFTAKALSYWLSKQVESHESQFGSIPFVPPSIPSPFQADLKRPDDGKQASGEDKNNLPDDKPESEQDKPKKKPKK